MYWLAAALLLVPPAGLCLVLVDPDGRVRAGRREALAMALVAWALYAVVVTELLSLGVGHDLTAAARGHLTQGWLLIAWGLAATVGGWLVWRKRAVAADALRDARQLWDEGDVWLRFGVVACAVIASLVGLVALVAAPNNWDSMTYHLMRVEQWVRLGGVAHYATHYEPQVYQPPGAEMLVAQGRVLTGGDRYTAAVQWVAFAASLPLASLAAARLGAGRLGQVLAALLVATMPMALMQASSTQNDLVLALWLLVAATFALAIDEDAEKRLLLTRTLFAAAALALAVLTKGTALVFGLPVSALLAWAVVRRAGLRRAAFLAVAALAIVLAVNAGQWQRNHQTYGSYVSAGSGPNLYTNDAIGPATLVSNLARNASNHLDMPVGAVNRATQGAIRDGLGLLGIDPDDPATTFTGQTFKVGPFGPHEDHAGNFALLALSLWAVISVVAFGAWRSRRRVAWALMLLAQVVLFCTLLKWQNWHARLHLPMFVLAAPLVAACLAELKRRGVAYAVAAALLLATPLYVFYNYTRPLVGARSVLTTDRASQYFLPRPNIETAYRSLGGEIQRRGVKRLAVVAPIDQWEYPIYALASGAGLVVYDTMVENPTARYRSGLAAADAVAGINCDEGRAAALVQSGFKAIPIANTPARHDARLDEVPVTVGLWVRP